MLLRRLSCIAQRNGHCMMNLPTQITAYPVLVCSAPSPTYVRWMNKFQVHPVQSNAFDCGLWVLMWIAAVMRGFETTPSIISEECMPFWRTFLSTLIHGLPVKEKGK